MTTTPMRTRGFFDPGTCTISYLVWDPQTRRAAIIDPVLDYDFKSGHTSTVSADALLACIGGHELTVDWSLETHAHADHLSGAHYLRSKVGGRIAIGEHIRTVQATFKNMFNLEPAFTPDGRQFDHLFHDGERFKIGNIEATALLVPGHTPADMAYWMNGSIFVGDTLFMPDVGSARADFPGGNAHPLFASMRRILALSAGHRDVRLPRLPAIDQAGPMANHCRPAPRARRHPGGVRTDPAGHSSQSQGRRDASGRIQWCRCASRSTPCPWHGTVDGTGMTPPPPAWNGAPRTARQRHHGSHHRRATNNGSKHHATPDDGSAQRRARHHATGTRHDARDHPA